MKNRILIASLLLSIILGGCSSSEGSDAPVTDSKDTVNTMDIAPANTSESLIADEETDLYDGIDSDEAQTAEYEDVILETYSLLKLDSKWQNQFSEGRAWIGFSADKYNSFNIGVIDTDGKLIYCSNYVSLYGNGLFCASPFQDGVAFYRETRSENSPCGIIDQNGNVLFETQIGPDGGYLILAYGNGQFLVTQHIQNFDTDEWRYGTIDKNGNIINEMKTCDEHFKPQKWIDNKTSCAAIRYIGENFFVLPTGLYNTSTAHFSPFPYYVSGLMDEEVVGDFYEGYTAIVIQDGNNRFAYTISSDYEEPSKNDIGQWKNGYDTLENAYAKKADFCSDSSYSEGLIFGFEHPGNPTGEGYYDKDLNLAISLEQYRENQISGGPFSGGYAPIMMMGADKGYYVSIIDRQGNLQYEPIKVDFVVTDNYVDNSMNGFVQVMIDGEIKIIEPDGTISTPGADDLSKLADLSFGGVSDGLICIDNDSLHVRFVSLDGSKTIDCAKVTNNTVNASVVP